MKTKSTKYEEAIERNLKHVKRYRADKPEITLEELRKKVGIKKDDTRYDSLLTK